MLGCRGISKAYGGVAAVEGVDFEGRAGEVHALLGENGAGKSTFIKILGGAVAADRGEIELGGEPVEIATPNDADRLGVAVAYQELSLLPDLTVAENIYLRAPGDRPALFSKRRLAAKAQRLFEELGVPTEIDPRRRVSDLGIAVRHVVEIARCVRHAERVLVLDEATASLGAEETRWLLDLARRQAAAGKLVIFISHRIDEIRSVADRVTVLRGGRSIVTGPIADYSDEEVIEAMLGRKPQRLYPPPISPPGEEVMLSVRGFSAGSRLRGIDFDVRAGEILGVGGLQGHGQSQLLLGLFGVLGSSGQVEVGGKRVRVRSPHEAIRAGIGLALIPEDRGREGLMLRKSIRENLALPVLGDLGRRGLLSVAAEEEMARAALERFHVKASGIEQPVGALSGGNQQKVLIAKMLNVGARVLLFHDLTRGVDVGTKAEIFALARELTAEGYAIVMYASDNQELVNMCDRILVLREGEVATVLEAGTLSEEEILRAALGAASPTGVVE